MLHLEVFFRDSGKVLLTNRQLQYIHWPAGMELRSHMRS